MDNSTVSLVFGLLFFVGTPLLKVWGHYRWKRR